MRPVLVLLFHAEAAGRRGAPGPSSRGGPLLPGETATRPVAGRGCRRGEDRGRAAGRISRSASGSRRNCGHFRVGDGLGEGGLIVLGSGSIPLAQVPDLRRFVEVAAARAGTRSRTTAIPRTWSLSRGRPTWPGLPPLPADNALPRWLEERAGVTVADLRRRLAARRGRGHSPGSPDAVESGRSARTRAGRAPLGMVGGAPLIGERLDALSDVLRNRRAELLVAGRVSASTLRWLESGVACRVRALVEERGLRAASRLAQSNGEWFPGSRPPARPRPPRPLARRAPSSASCSTATAPNRWPATSPALADAAVIDSAC